MAMTDPILTARGSDWETSQGAVEIMPVAVRAAVDVYSSPAAMLAPRVVVWCTERGCRTRSRRPSVEGCRRQIARRPFRYVAEIARGTSSAVSLCPRFDNEYVALRNLYTSGQLRDVRPRSYIDLLQHVAHTAGQGTKTCHRSLGDEES